MLTDITSKPVPKAISSLYQVAMSGWREVHHRPSGPMVLCPLPHLLCYKVTLLNHVIQCYMGYCFNGSLTP